LIFQRLRERLGALQSPLAVKQSPLAVKQSPLAVKQSPLAVKQSPLAVKQSPLAVKQSPLAVKQSPLAVKQSPLVVKQSPRGVKHSRLGSKHVGLGVRHSRLGNEHTPLGVKHLRLGGEPTPGRSWFCIRKAWHWLSYWLCHSDARQVYDLPSPIFFFQVFDLARSETVWLVVVLAGKSWTCRASEWRSHCGGYLMPRTILKESTRPNFQMSLSHNCFSQG